MDKKEKPVKKEGLFDLIVRKAIEQQKYSNKNLKLSNNKKIKEQLK